MKKKTSIILCAALVLSLAVTACGKTEKTADSKESSEEETAKKITIGCMDTYTPYAYLDEDGNPTGYDVEAMAEAAKRAGYEAEFTAVEWDALFPGLDSGKWDCVANQLSRTDERVELYNMGTVPYYMNSMKLVVKADSGIQGLDDMDGAKLDAIVGDYATGLLEDYLEESPGAFELVYSEGTMAMLLEDIVNDRVAGTVNDPFTVNMTAEENEISDKVKLVGDNLFSDYIYSAFAKTEEGAQMCADFDEALKSMIEDGTLSGLSKKYFDYDYNETLNEGIVK